MKRQIGADALKQLPVVALFLLSACMAVSALAGPLYLNLIRFPISVEMNNQLIGGEIVSLFFVAPLGLVAGLAWLRSSRTAPFLALGPALFALYTYPQFIIGPQYHRYPGNSEYAVPMYMLMTLIAWPVAAVAWRRLQRQQLPSLRRRVRQTFGTAMIVVSLLFATAWIASIVVVLSGAAPPEYMKDQTLFWQIRFQDLVFLIPCGLVTGVGLLHNRGWAHSAAYGIAGLQLSLTASVATMAGVMTVRGDPAANLAMFIFTTATALVFFTLFALLLSGIGAVSDQLPAVHAPFNRLASGSRRDLADGLRGHGMSRSGGS